MSIGFILTAVYLCGYGVTAVMVAADMHDRIDNESEPEVRALYDENPGFVAAVIAVLCFLGATLWPLMACRRKWWRHLVGRA